MGSLPKWITPIVKQTWVSLMALFIKVGGGMSLGFTSCLLTAINDPESDIKMDIHTSSWYASSIAIGFTMGYIAATFSAKYGRRKAIIINCIPGIIGQFITCFAPNVTALIIGRILNGATLGCNSLLAVIVIGEYTSPKSRGMFLNMATASLNIGGLLVHTLGYYISWRTLALIIAIPFILCLIIAYTSPESPSWLADQKEYEKSRQVFYWLRGRTEETTREIEELIKAQSFKKINKTAKETTVGILLKFKKRNFVKPISISLIAIFLMEVSGRHYFPTYASQLIRDIMSEGFNIQYFNIAIDILIIVSGFTASYLVRIVKMRTLLFTSGSATAVMLISACLTLYFVKNGIIPESYSWVTLIFFALFFIMANLGCTCIPIALVGEIFPLEHRVAASVVIAFLSSCTLAIILKVLPLMVVAFEIYGAFSIMAVGMCIMISILYFVLPETKDKTLQQIENYFGDKKGGDDRLADDDDVTRKLNDV